MLYYTFKNYEEFKERFGIVEHGNGAKSRKNKILLSIYKDRSILHKVATGEISSRWFCNNIIALKNEARTFVSAFTEGEYVSLLGRVYHHPQFKTDKAEGLCEDGDCNAVRYINTERGRVFKMKAGKFYRAIIDGTDKVRDFLPEPVKIWLCEEFAAEWRAFASTHLQDERFTLHVDDNFKDIYSCSCCVGDFGSCMEGRDNWSFYRDAVKAKAAYLTNEEGDIVARCVIYTEVHTSDRNILRLAERQYSSDGDEDLMRMLIARLISAGEIDGYKRVGAGCSDARAFVDVNGNYFKDDRFWIKCRLEPGDIVSYQDSFKWYDFDEKKSYNYEASGASGDLAITDGEWEGEREWSNYHDEYIDRDDAVYVESRDDWFYYDNTVYAENSGQREVEWDCVYINGSFYFIGDDPEANGIEKCPWCNEYYVADDAVYSDITDDYYCCDDCRARAEQDYKEANWYYCDHDGEYYEDEDDLVVALKWSKSLHDYMEYKICSADLGSLIEEGKATYCEDDGEYYIDAINFEGEPVHYYAGVA